MWQEGYSSYQTNPNPTVIYFLSLFFWILPFKLHYFTTWVFLPSLQTSLFAVWHQTLRVTVHHFIVRLHAMTKKCAWFRGRTEDVRVVKEGKCKHSRQTQASRDVGHSSDFTGEMFERHWFKVLPELYRPLAVESHGGTPRQKFFKLSICQGWMSWFYLFRHSLKVKDFTSLLL